MVGIYILSEIRTPTIIAPIPKMSKDKQNTITIGNNQIRTGEVAAMALSARKPGGISCPSRPVLARPASKDAMGIMSFLRLLAETYPFYTDDSNSPYDAKK